MSNSAISATVSRFNLGEEPLANQIKYFPLPTYIPLCSAVIYLSRIGLQPDLLLLLGREKQSEISDLYFLPTNAHLFYVGKYIFTPSVLKIFLVGYFSFKKPLTLIFISLAL